MHESVIDRHDSDIAGSRRTGLPAKGDSLHFSRDQRRFEQRAPVRRLTQARVKSVVQTRGGKAEYPERGSRTL